MKKIISGTLCVIVVGSLVVGTALLYKKQDSQIVKMTSFSSRSYVYTDLQQIDKDAQLVIGGKVISSAGVREVKDPSTDASNPALLYSDYEVLVETVWKGDARLVGKKIIVRQDGGQKDNVIARASDDVMLSPKEDAILFLTPSLLRDQLPLNDGWVILGVGAGHATIQDGRVTFAVVDPFAQSFEGQPSEKLESALDTFYKQGR